MILFSTHPIEECDTGSFAAGPFSKIDLNPNFNPKLFKQQHIKQKWKIFPKFITETFENEFSSDILNGAASRLSSTNWIDVLQQFKNFDLIDNNIAINSNYLLETNNTTSKIYDKKIIYNTDSGNELLKIHINPKSNQTYIENISKNNIELDVFDDTFSKALAMMITEIGQSAIHVTKDSKYILKPNNKYPITTTIQSELFNIIKPQ